MTVGGQVDLWNHCENPYPFVPAEVLEEADSVRASLPNKYCDPKIAARLYDEIFDEYQLCDELGLNIVTNEHHSGINNLWAASPVITGVVARITKKVAHPVLGHAGHGAARPGAGRRGIRHDRRALEGPAGDRLRQVRRHRDGLRRRQPDAHPRARMGGDRPDREGADVRRTGRSAGKASSSPTRTSTSGRAPTSSRARSSGRRPSRPADLRRTGPPRHHQHAAVRRLRQDAGRRSTRTSRRGPRPALPPPGEDRFSYMAFCLCRRHRRGGAADRPEDRLVSSPSA